MNQREPRIAILVLGCLSTVYGRCIQTIRATWGATPVQNVDIFYVYGGQGAGPADGTVDAEELIGRSRPHLEDGEIWACRDILLCGSADSIHVQKSCILRKRLIAFGYLASERHY